ncbi:MAG: amidase, partial [Myxococcales bacterium]
MDADTKTEYTTRVSPLPSPLLSLSGLALARLLRNREVTSEQVVDVHIARIREVNGRLNAVVHERFDEARVEAKRADEALRTTPHDELPPFFGVPCTIKETFAFTGLPQTGGLVAHKDFIAQHDAITVTRLRKAGAIPLGITNVSELAMWMECFNKVYGRTNNAYDAARTAGGSSGGEGAIIGAGASPFGLGSDIGGSIRMPAFFNGVFGHKPTGGLIPNSGQFPSAENDALRILATGPLARRAEDLMPLVRILAGPDGEDACCRSMELGDPASVDLRSVTVYHVPDNGRIGVSEDLRAAQRRAVRALALRGARVVTTEIEGFSRSLEIWAATLQAQDSTSFGSRLASGGTFHPGRELLRWALRRSPHTLPAIGLAALEILAKSAQGLQQDFIAEGNALRGQLASLLGERGVLLFPSYSQVAPRHYWPLLFPVQWMYTAIFNALEVPVTQVPLGLDDRGIPLGVQVAARHGNDHVTIAVAMALEEAFGGWIAPK